MLTLLSNEINKQYANQDIKTNLIGSTEDYYVKFTKMEPAGFPFKIGFKIIDWSEESRVGKIECIEPIYFGYNLITQKIFGNYSGDIYALHKPLQSKFGSKVICQDYALSIRIPLNLKLLNILRKGEKNKFELINFVKNIELRSGKVEIIDLVDNEKLFDQDYNSFVFSFDKRKYYKSTQDFIYNVPSQLNIYQTTKINHSSFGRRLLPPNIIFGLNLPFTTSGTNKITIKINNPKFEDFAKDLEIHYSAIDSTSAIHRAHGNIIYKGKIQNKDGKFSLKADSIFELKSGFFDKVFSGLKYFTSFAKTKSVKTILRENITMDWLLFTVLEPLDNPTIRDLERRSYELNIDADIVREANHVDLKISDLSLFSGSTGFRLKSENKLGDDLHWYFAGVISFNNYLPIIDLIFKKDVLGRMNNSSPIIKDVYFETAKNFLKVISDHPESTSDDLSFEFSANSTKIDKATIGNIEAKNIKIFYDLALYKEIVKRSKIDGINDESNQLLLKIPEDGRKAFDLILQKPHDRPQDIDPDMWDKLIK
jgi:hypothetical protein